MNDHPEPHLRDVPHVSVLLTESDAEALESALADFQSHEYKPGVASGFVSQPVEMANQIAERIDGSCWLTLTAAEVFVAHNAVILEDERLTDRLRQARSEIERMDAAAKKGGNRGPNWGDARQAALRESDFQCEKCNIQKNLHVHHIIPFRRFLTASEANAVENLEVLCASCHGEK